MKNLTPEQQALLDKIDEQMRDICDGYISDPITPEQLRLMKQAFEKTLGSIRENEDKFTDHVNVILDPYDLEHGLLHIHMVPHPNAPKWVEDVLSQIKSAQSV